MKYEPEEKLIEKVQSGEYGWKEYITRTRANWHRNTNGTATARGLIPIWRNRLSTSWK